MNCLLAYLLACLLACLLDWLVDWLTDWLIDWLIDWLTEWSIGQLIHWSIRFYQLRHLRITLTYETSLLMPAAFLAEHSYNPVCFNSIALITMAIWSSETRKGSSLPVTVSPRAVHVMRGAGLVDIGQATVSFTPATIVIFVPIVILRVSALWGVAMFLWTEEIFGGDRSEIVKKGYKMFFFFVDNRCFREKKWK